MLWETHLMERPIRVFSRKRVTRTMMAAAMRQMFTARPETVTLPMW